jgi:putative hemolysin
MDFQTTPSTFAEVFGAQGTGEPHIVDQLIAERATHLSHHLLWPVLRPFLYKVFHYDQAVAMADRIFPMPGREAFDYLSSLLALEVVVRGLENIPAAGTEASGFILAPNHPTGIADGIAVFDALKTIRPDLAIFANRDALRVCAGMRDLIIPVEWRQGEKSHAKSRDTLEMTARAFADNRAIVLFPSGRIAFWNENRLAERPWQTSIVALARRYGFPIIPAHITARNSGLFYFLSKYSTELRDMTVFHELLNKKKGSFSITFGRPIAAELLEGDAADVAARLQEHTVHQLEANPEADFTASLTRFRSEPA